VFSRPRRRVVPRHIATVVVACVEHPFAGEEGGSGVGHIHESRSEKNDQDEPRTMDRYNHL